MEFLEEFKAECAANSLLGVGFIGCGNMGSAILQGILDSKLLKPENILVSAKTEKSIARLQKLNVNTTKSNQDVFELSRIIFLCTKPSTLDSVAKDLKNVKRDNFEKKQLVSVLAGTTIETIRDTLNLPGLSIVRTMPNTPLQVSAGATAISILDSDRHEAIVNYEVTKAIFKTLGIIEIVSDEKLFHAFVALSGSGPAYIYLFVEALADAGVKQGLSRETASRFAAQTVFGASKMIIDTGIHPAQLKDNVASPGGTTIHAIHELEKGGLRNTVINAVEAAAKRSIEMSKK